MRSVALIALAFAMGCTVKEGEAGPGREAGTDEEQGDDTNSDADVDDSDTAADSDVPEPDLDEDGVVGVADVLAWLTAFGG